MTRTVTEAEKIYRRVRDGIQSFPPHVLALLRVAMCTPSQQDFLRKKIKEQIGMIVIEFKDYQYTFWYGERELDELIRQII